MQGGATLVSAILLLSVGLCIVSGKVVELTDQNFDSVVNGRKFVVVEFYTKWCRFCATLEPIYAEVAEQLAPQGITMARVNAEAATEVQEKFGVNSFPVLLIFRNGQPFPYEGPGERAGVQGMVEYFTAEYNRPIEVKNHVMDLSSDNFQSTIDRADLTVVEFYAPWCSHCKKLEPIYSVVARQLKARAPDVLMARVDATKEEELAKQYQIEAYPTMMLFRKGHRYDYRGHITEDEMLEYLLAESGPGSHELTSKQQFVSFVTSSQARAIAFVDPDNSAFLEMAVDAVNNLRKFVKLGYTHDLSFVKGVAYGDMIMYHPTHLVSSYEKGSIVIPKAAEFDNSTTLALRMLKASRPLVGHVNMQNIGAQYRDRPLLLAFLHVDWKGEGLVASRYWHETVAKVANEFKNRDLMFALADEEEFYSSYAEFGFADWGEDVAVGIYAGGPHKYRLEDEVTEETLREFIQGFFDKSLQHYIRSEPVSRSNVNSKSGLVKKIVGKNFEKAVKQQPSIVWMCYPDNHDCVDTEKMFTAVAKQYKGKLVFMKLDVSKNDPPLFVNIDAFPTIYLFTSDKAEGGVKMMQKFDSEKSLVDFITKEMKQSNKKKTEL